MKYPEIVKRARKIVRVLGEPIIVYQFDDASKRTHYNYDTQQDFDDVLAEGLYPVIKLLTLMPNGKVVQ